MGGDVVTISGDGLTASINPLGAELFTLRDEAGQDLLWNGDPSVWAGRAPLLFPIVGTLSGGRYRLGEKTYELPRHGFGRRRLFSVLEALPESAQFRLVSDEETRKVYPFDFELDVSFTITGRRLEVFAEAANSGDVPLPVSFGFHPAFRWPLPYGSARTEHRIVFDAEQPEAVRRLDADGLLDPSPRPTPVTGRTLTLDDDLFAEDALIFTELAGHALTYGGMNGPKLRIEFLDTPHLGIWSKRGAAFVCIEPWQGFSDPAGFAGEIWDKPGMARLEAGERRRWRMSVEVV